MLLGVGIIIDCLLDIPLAVQKQPHDYGSLFQIALAIRRWVVSAGKTLLEFICVWGVICPGT